MALKPFSGTLDDAPPLKPFAGELDPPTQATPATAAIERPRTWTQAATDTGRSLAAGVGSVVRGGGALYGLATGDMDNAATRLGQSVRDYWQEGQTDVLKSDRAERSAAIDQADGIVGKAGAAVVETLKRPRLLVDSVAENVASFLPAGAAARLGTVASKGAGLAAGAATKVGTGAGIATGAVQQGADVSLGAYESAMAKDDATWNSNPEYAKRIAAGESADTVKHEMALRAARITMPAAAAVSALTQFIPGGAMAERFAAGAAAKAARVGGKEVGGLAGRAVNAAKGIAGEGVQEALEEGGGQYVANLQSIDPNQDMGEGVGEAAGLGAVAGGGMGGVFGAIQRPGAQPPIVPPPVQENVQPAADPATTVAQPATPDPLDGATINAELDAQQTAGIPAVNAVPTLADGSPLPDPSAGPLSKGVNIGAETGAIPTAPFPNAAPGSLADVANKVSPFGYTAPTFGYEAPTFPPAPSDGRTRLAQQAQAQGIDPRIVLALDDAEAGGLDEFDDTFLAGYAKTLWADVQSGRREAPFPQEAARGPAQEIAGPVQERPGLDSVGGRGNDAPVPGDVAAPVGGSASQAAGLAATTGERAPAGADEAAGAQAEGVNRDRPLPNEREGDAPVGAWVAGPKIPGVAPADAVRQVMEVPIDQIDATEFDSAGNIAPEKRADAERYAEAMRNGDQFPNARGSVLPNGKIKLQDGHRRLAAAMANGETTLRIAVNPMPATQPAASAPAPRPEPSEPPSAVPAPAAAPGAQESAPPVSAATSTPAAPAAVESQSAEAFTAPGAGVSAGSREEGQQGVKGVQERITMSRPESRGGDVEVDAVRIGDTLTIKNGIGYSTVQQNPDGSYTVDSGMELGMSPQEAVEKKAERIKHSQRVQAEQKRVDADVAAVGNNPVRAALVKMANGEHPEKAMSRMSDADVRAVAKAMGHKHGPKASTGAIIERIGEQARSVWIAKAQAAQSQPEAPKPKPTPNEKAKAEVRAKKAKTISEAEVRRHLKANPKNADGSRKTVFDAELDLILQRRAAKAKAADEAAKADMPTPSTQASDVSENAPKTDASPAPVEAKAEPAFTAEDLARVRAKPANERTDAEVAAANAFTREQARPQREAEAKAQAEREAAANDTDGFADALPPMQRKRVIDALNKTVRMNGMFDTRKAHMRRAVADGARVGESGEGRALLHKGGSYTLESALSKTALDYAEHLAAKDSKPAAQAASEPAAKIDDFGEKLEGARKFLPPSLKETLGDDQIASLPLSKVWPSDTHLEIEDPMTAAMAFTARNEIPPKPRTPRNVAAWVTQVKMFRALMNKFTTESMDRLLEIADEKGFASLRAEFFPRVQLLAQLPRESWGRVEKVGHYPNARRLKTEEELKRDGFVAELRAGSTTYYDYFKVDPKTRQRSERIVPWGSTSSLHDELFTPAPHSTVTIDGKTTTFDVPAIGPDEAGKVLELLGQAKPQKGGLTSRDFEVRSKYGSKTAFINRKGDAAYRKLKEFTGDDAVKQAQAYLKDNVPALAEAWEGVKARDNVGKGDIRRAANEERKGENRRNGKDVTEAMFEAAFGFRGVQFGNWVKQGKGGKDRQGLLNDAYDGLLDLADVLGIPSRAISLEGTLGLSLGAQGSGKHAATFYPDRLVINLTKTRGSGSLAHEWFHALDNYFARKRGGEVPFTGDNTAYRENNFITYKPEPMLRSTKGFGTKTKAEVARLHKVHPKANAYYPENWEPSPDHKQGVRPVVEKAFAELVAALNASPMAKRSADIDGVKVRGDVISTDGYWSRIIERGARSFENYVISKMAQRGWSNDFLVNIRSLDQWREIGKNEDRYPYPKPEEEAPIAEAFDKLFATIEARETDTGIALESVEEMDAAEDEPFYSATLRAVTEGKGAPKRGNAEVWKGWLDGAVRRGDMKQSERDWLGLDAWLNKQEKPVTREQLADFIRANEVRVEEVTLGEGVDSSLPAGWTVVENEDGDGFELLDEQGIMRGEGETRAEAIADGQDRDERGEAGAPKFSAYQLPGGENYRELLLTLPDAKAERRAELEKEIMRLHAQRIGATNEQDNALLDQMLPLQRELNNGESGFRSGHFDQPNILAHVRFNERTDADGKRVLFIEEIQSDWHQAGRKQGYAAPKKPLRDAELAEMDRLAAKGARGRSTDEDARYGELVDRNAGNTTGVPDAPFKATDEWAMLAFKRMVRHAAENGFDRIAWTTGEQQAERYDLSKHIDELNYNENEGGGTLIGNKDDVSYSILDKTDVKRGDLADYIGKEMAERLLAQEPNKHGLRTLRGVDLKVGGEGMKGFYDRILPSAVNKWAKRFGGKVGQSNIDASTPQNPNAKWGREPILTTVHSIDLTPQMRDAALQGMPLFQMEAGDVAPSDLTPAERAAFERAQVDRAGLSAKVSQEKGQADAEASGLAQMVKRLLGRVGVPIHYLRGDAGLYAIANEGYIAQLKDEQRRRGQTKKGLTTHGLYLRPQDTKSGKAAVVVYTHTPGDNVLKVFTAAHEIAGHHGLRGLLGKDLEAVLDLARQNPTVRKVADSMFRGRDMAGKIAAGKMTPRQAELLATEEALADLAAANATGNWARIEEKHGVKAPLEMRNKFAAMLANVIRKLKALFKARSVGFSDAQVRQLLENARKAAGQDATTGGAALESAEVEVIQVPAGTVSDGPVRRGDVFRYSDTRWATVMEANPGGNLLLRIEGTKNGKRALTTTEAKTREVKTWPRLGRAQYQDGAYLPFKPEAIGQPESALESTEGGSLEGMSRADAIAEAKRLGLPATGATDKIASLVRIATADPATWSREDFDAILPHLSIHQDVRDGSADRVATVMARGLDKGMVDPAAGLEPGSKDWSWAKGYSGGDVYAFISGGLKFAGKDNPRLAPGNKPLFHAKPEKGGSLFDALQQPLESTEDQTQEASNPSILESVEGFTLSDNPTLDQVRIPGEVNLSALHKGGVKAALERIGQKFTSLKPKVLALIPLQELDDFSPKRVAADGQAESLTPAVAQYIKLQNDMQAFRNGLYVDYDQVAQDLQAFASEGTGFRGWMGNRVSQQGRDLFALMHDSTVAGVDPSEVGTRFKEPEKAAKYRELQERYNALAGEKVYVSGGKAFKTRTEAEAAGGTVEEMTRGQYLFKATRDAYAKQTDLLDTVLEANVQRTAEITINRARRRLEAREKEIDEDGSMSAAEKKKARDSARAAYDDTVKEGNVQSKMAALRSMLEKNRVPRPYFPLKRYGEFWVSVLKDGKLAGFSKFQNAEEQQAYSKEMIARGFETRLKYERDGSAKTSAMIDPTFVAEVEGILAGLPNEIRDEVWQAYLERMPDMSLRKSFIHRKNVPGYHFDALKAFGSSMFHSSYQLSRLKYGVEMQEALDVLGEQANELRDKDAPAALAADMIRGELKERHAFIMNPTNARWAQTVTGAAFIYSLGANPAHLFLNATQTIMLGLPIMGSRYGFKRATAAIGKATQDFAKGKGHVDKANLTTDEHRAFKEMQASGIIEKSQAHDMAGIGAEGVEYSAVRKKVMDKVGWFMHQSERFNREVAAIAGYRLARAEGKSHEAAVAAAEKMVYTIHFDYSNSGRARIMQGDMAKALLVFRNYQANMIYRLFRDIHQSIRGESVQVKREARKQLGAIFGMYAFFAGTMGVPFYGLAMALAGLGDDDDDPVTAEQQFVNGTVEFLGPTAASILLRGLPGTAFDVDLTERVGMGNLWFRSPNQEMEGRDAYYYWMEQLLGAGLGPLKGFFDGVNLARQGQFQRGLERMAPAALRNPLQAMRQAQEGGVTSLDGDLIKETTGGDYIAKALGFQPLSVSEQYDKNSNLKNADRRLSNRREKLLNKYFLAMQMGDDTAEVLADVQAFNLKNPEYAITRDTFKRSARLRNRNKLMSENGIVMTRRMRRLQERTEGDTE